MSGGPEPGSRQALNLLQLNGSYIFNLILPNEVFINEMNVRAPVSRTDFGH